MLAACHAKPSPIATSQQHPRVRLTATEWTARCRDRIDLVRIALARIEPAFNDAKLDVDDKPWNPRLHFEARTGENGLWWASVMCGQHPCEHDDVRGFVDWRDGTSEIPMLVDRYMRIGDDVAWLQADHVPENTAIAFRREMQFALRECLLDAQGVALAKPPANLCRDDDGDL